MMKSTLHDDSLHDLLCLREFHNTFGIPGTRDFTTAFTGWAEKEVLSGNPSETLLILASLNLDACPDRDEVESYLIRYLQEQHIDVPGSDLSALIWLRIQLWSLMAENSASETEGKLLFFTQYFFDFPLRAFARISSLLDQLYWELFDEAIPDFSSRASEMSDEELSDYVQNRVTPFYRILNNNDWLSLLTR